MAVRALPATREPLSVAGMASAAEKVFPWCLLIGVTISLWASTSVHANDFYQYWAVDLSDPYRVSDVREYGVLYSPAFLQATEPFRWLPWQTAKLIYLALEMAALAWMTGPWVAVFLAGGGMTLVGAEIINANTSLLLGAAMWSAYRYPGLWAFAFLTKVTPGIGVLWYAVRQEWRSLGIAFGVTGGIVLLSVILAPHLWTDWMAVLAGNVGVSRGTDFAPLWAREIASVGLIAYGASKNWYWTVPMGAALSHPDSPMIIWVVMLGAIRFYQLTQPRSRPTR